jgi:hypothetical protein
MNLVARVAMAACCLLAPPSALAQPAPAFRPQRFTVSAGAVASAGYRVGDVTASLRRNTLGNPPPFTLLEAQSDLTRAIGIDGRLGFALTRTVAIEVGAAYAQPELGVTIARDPEATGEAFASERIQQYVVDVSGIFQLPLAMGQRTRPYVIAGGGYLRQLHEGRLLAQTGQTLHLGGGLHYWFGGLTTARRPFGARAEVRYVLRRGGVEFEDRSRGYPALSVLAFVGL